MRSKLESSDSIKTNKDFFSLNANRCAVLVAHSLHGEFHVKTNVFIPIHFLNPIQSPGLAATARGMWGQFWG